MKPIPELNKMLEKLVLELVKDPAHGILHMTEVFNNMVEINEKLGTPYSKDMLWTTALCHDMFTEEDRPNHHNLACAYILGMLTPYEHCTKFVDYYCMSDIKLMADAVREHRASVVTNIERSLLSKILYLADKGKPDTVNTLKRCVIATNHKYPDISLDDLYAKVFKHLQEKFCTGGYLYNDTLYSEWYDTEVAIVKKEMDELVNSKYLLKLWIKNILKGTK